MTGLHTLSLDVVIIGAGLPGSPCDHPFGCKRVPLENGYYEVFNRTNVTLVDLRETPIGRITQTGIRTTACTSKRRRLRPCCRG